ncbi:Membrane transporter protein, variant 2 [Balamuthia mandrillaris]
MQQQNPVLTFIGGALCAGSGIGGGGFYLPVFILLLGLNAHVAVPLSKATIVGIALGGYVVTCRRRHPLVDRPLIYYSVAALMEPMTLVGTIVGVFLNVVSPDWLIVIFLACLLAFSAYKTISKGVALHKKEMLEANRTIALSMNNSRPGSDSRFIIGEEEGEEGEEKDQGEKEQEEDDEKATKTFSFGESREEEREGDDENIDEEEGESHSYEVSDWDKRGSDDTLEVASEELREIRIQESSFMPWREWTFLALTWLGIIVFSILKGGGTEKSIAGIECGSLVYWLVIFLSVSYLLLLTWIYGRRLLRIQKKKDAHHYQYAEGDIKWTLRNVTLFPVFSVLAGLAAGYLGIGGGMVKGPLMLEMGVLPYVAVSTSAFMIIFTSSATTIQYLILGALPWGMGLWYFGVGFFAAILGHLGVAWMLKRYNKQSYINFLLGTLILVSGGIMLVVVCIGVWRDLQEGRDMGFNALCSQNVVVEDKGR